MTAPAGRAKGAAGARVVFRVVGSLLVSTALCLLLLRHIDPREIFRWLARVDRPLFAGYVLLSIAGLLARAWRYRMLIGEWVGLFPLVLVTAARNFLVDLFPARLGSLSYVFLLTRRFGVPLEPVLSSFVVTFFYDLFAMTLLIGVALVLEFGRFEGAAVVAALATGLGVVVVAVFLRLGSAARFAAARLRRFARGESIAARLERTAVEVERTHARGLTLELLAISFVIRLLKFSAYWALLLGVVRGQDLQTVNLPFWSVFLGIAAAELSATLPVHGIAGIGTYETAWAIGFRELGVPSRVAILSGFATHLLSQIYDYSVGLVALAAALGSSRESGRASGGTGK